LVSALVNLMENAVTYSDEGSVVELHVMTDGTWVELAVCDHGIGIPRRDLERIFERFYRVDPARARNTGGTGLGLAIVRHVAEVPRRWPSSTCTSPTSCSSTSCCPGCRASTCAASCAGGPRCRSSWCRPRPRRSTW